MEQSSFISDLVLIPDPTNNRIQVFKSESENFIYVTQFGNLDNTVKRSLPTFEGHYSNPFLEHTDFMYEPLVNMLNEASGNNTGITSGSSSGDTSRSSLFTKEIDNYNYTNNTQTQNSDYLDNLIKKNLNEMDNYCKNEFRNNIWTFTN